LIGEGRIAQRHKAAVEAIGGEIVTKYDPQFSGNGYCRRLDAEFFDPVDWVSICSPTHCHYGHVKQALHYGKKVICEKPYVLPWQPVVEDDNVWVVMQMRWLKELPETASVVRAIFPRNAEYFKSWKGDPELTGGLFFDLFIHYIDLARRYRCRFEGLVISEGDTVRRVDGIDLTVVNMDGAFESMYRDIVFRGIGVRPKDVAELHWMLGRYTERFGAGRDIIGKKIEVYPDGVI
jgi:hypothetical protein